MTTNAVAPIEALRGTLTKMQPEFTAALPPQISPDKFIRTTLTAVQMQPELLNADRRSLFGAVMKSAQDGLLPDGREAALVIFRSKGGAQVQYMPMIGGILKKLRNSGELASISAQVVYENDQFDYHLGDDEKIEHKPQLFGERGKPIAVYAIAKTKDGAIYREVMSVEEVERVRSVSRSGNGGPWSQWWGEMAKKTVIRRLCKRLPSSADLDQMLMHDNENYDLRRTPDATPRTNQPSRLLAAIQIDEAPAEEVEVETETEVDEEREAIVAEAE
jgi:recombination protein RecT